MKKTLANYYLLFMLIFIAFIIIIIASIYNNTQNDFLKATVEEIRNNVINQYKIELKNRTTIVEQYINGKNKLTESKLRKSISSRVEEAHAIANNLYEKYKDTKSSQEIKELIITSLRDIRFNNGRGYYFIDDIKGKCLLFPLAPKLEGKSLIKFQDVNKKYVIKEFVEIAKTKGSGFSVYYTNKYKLKKDEKYKKIAYVKLFEPYQFIIGTGEYIDDVEKDIKEEIVKEVNNFKGVNKGIATNIFEVHNYNGGKDFATIIVHQQRQDLVGKKISTLSADLDGTRYREKCLDLIKTKGEGFITYKYKKPNEEQITEKLTYAKQIKYSNWVLSSNVDFDSLEKLIKTNQEKTKHIQKEGNKKALITIFIVFLILIGLSFIISKRINVSYKKIIYFFKNAAFKKEKIDTSKFLSEDFKLLGDLANEMVENIHIKQEKLKKLNEELENKVEVKTKKLKELNEYLEYKNIELKKNYFTDNLTGLGNRNRFVRDLDLLDDVTVLIFDVDGFKNINDFYGIKTGDFLLVSLAKVVEDFAKTNGMNAYRLSSDEFLISSGQNIEAKNLKEFSSDFYRVFRKIDFYDETGKIKLNVSLTCAVATGKEHILSRVDVALNYAKRNKLAYAIYDENNFHMNKHKQNIFWREKIQYAIDNDLIEPYFQRIVNTDNLKEKKYECLIRIIDGDTIITPYQFLDVAKETKQYRYLTRIMIEKTFKRFQNEEAEFSINISISDIENEETVKYLEDKIVEYNMQNKLILEILESENMINSNKFLPFVNSMRVLGIRFALDDFGSGYSNFAFLLQMHPKFLKIDGSLIKNITDNKNSYNIVKTIVSFSKQINATVIAEFVENDEIVTILKELNISYMQGYHFSKPSADI